MPIGQDNNFCLFALLHQLQLAIVSWAVQLLHTSLMFCNFSKLTKHVHPSLKIIDYRATGIRSRKKRVMCSTFLGCQPATADILYYGCNSWVAEDWPKMRALGGVAEHTQPTIAVPLAQSSATGKLAVSSGRKKPPSKIWFPILNK